MTDPLESALRRAASLEYEGRLRDAETLYRQLTARPGSTAMAHYMYAQLKLLQGDYVTAWPHFMRRLETPFYAAKGTAALSSPLWDGETGPATASQTLLVHADEGLGDAIMCARYLPRAADIFGNVMFGVFEGFGRLFSSLGPEIQVVEYGEAWSGFDLHVHLFSLPGLFETSLGTVPEANCLLAEPDRVADWTERLSSDRLNVGVAWQGSPDHERDAERSIALKDLAPLTAVSDVTFYGLQVGAGVEQVTDLSGKENFVDLSDELSGDTDAMVETAAVISALDLVITVDSAVAHLTGALGKPAWVLLPKVPDWRWGLEGEITPWYPMARLFRASERYDWSGPVADIAAELNRLP